MLSHLPPVWQDWAKDGIDRGCTHESLNAVLATNGFLPIGGVQPPDTPSNFVLSDSTNALEIGCHISFSLASPRIVVVDDFLTDDECEHLKSLAASSLTRSTVVDRETGEGRMDTVRTSKGGFLSAAQTPTVAIIEERIAQFTGTPAANGEPFQILRYDAGDQYLAHHDWFDPTDPGSARHLRSGQRISTMLLYLNDVVAGGSTQFPSLGLTVRPKKRRALYFEYPAVSGSPDSRCLHGGSPVVDGEKWVATKWAHPQRWSN